MLGRFASILAILVLSVPAYSATPVTTLISTTSATGYDTFSTSVTLVNGLWQFELQVTAAPGTDTSVAVNGVHLQLAGVETSTFFFVSKSTFANVTSSDSHQGFFVIPDTQMGGDFRVGWDALTTSATFKVQARRRR